MDNFVNSVNSAGHVDPRNLVEQEQPAVSTEATPRFLNRVEVEKMLTEYVRDALPGENRIEAKTKMLACFDTLQKSQHSNIELDLSRLNLKALPENLSFLNGVSLIDLRVNQLESLPESIGGLSALSALDLGKNQLVQLPESIGGLSALSALDLGQNKLVQFPESISELSALETLNLRSNQLKGLPASIGQLSALKYLDLSHNKIESLPESISELSALDYLCLKYNQLQSLPASFGRLSALKYLYLESNQLENLPESIGQLSELECLDLRHNLIESLPESIGQLSGLENLALSSNRLDCLPESFGRLSALKTLRLIRNQLQSLPTSIGRLSALQKLSLAGNQLANLPESIGQLPALVSLSLTNNQLDCLPASVGQLSALTTLELDENRFESLPEVIGTLSALLTLRLSGNPLRNLPESIGNMSDLQDLELYRNNLSELPQSLVRLSNLCTVGLGSNPLPHAVIQQLQNAIVAHHALHPEQGPRIEYDMRQFNQVVEVKPLSEEIASWRAERHIETGTDVADVLHTAIGNLSTTESNAVSGQLARMRLTAHYAMAPVDVAQRINAVLDHIQNEPSVLPACAAIAVEGTETCDDRIALAFIELEEAIVHHQSLSESNLAKLVETAGGLHKSQLLKDIAQQKVSTLVGFVDPTEIILKYVVNLSKEFNLPSQLNDMIFHRCARQVTDQDIQSAREQICDKSTDEHLNTYLAKWEPWKQALSEKYPSEYQQAQLNASQGQEALQEEMQTLLEQLNAAKASQGELGQQYLDLMGQSNALHAQYRVVETGEVLKLTQYARGHAVSL